MRITINDSLAYAIHSTWLQLQRIYGVVGFDAVRCQLAKPQYLHRRLLAYPYASLRAVTSRTSL